VPRTRGGHGTGPDISTPRVVPAGTPDEVERAIEAAADVLLRGDLIALPTETVYGLACALNDDAIEHLLRAKGRPPQKGITILVDSLQQAERLADLPREARRLADRFWPGPLTLVVPARVDAELPMLLTGPRFTVGLRLPNHPLPRRLATRAGPLPLTSANRSGDPDATDASAVVDALGDAVSLVLDGGPAAGGVPSTVVAVEVAGESGGPEPASVRILRVGSLSAEEVESALR
jgi:L-threonylcarbamoyladenylate synthase